MQLFSRNKALVALSLGALAALGACGDDVTVTAPPVDPVVVTMSPSNLTLNVTEQGLLSVQITGGSPTPTIAANGCSSSSAAVTATVAAAPQIGCRVTANAPGNATITVTTTGGQSASAGVTVTTPAPAISNLSVSPASANLAPTQTLTITPSITRVGTPTITWSVASSNTAFVTVGTPNATTGATTITGVAPGSSVITVTAVSGGITLSQSMNVTVAALPSAITSLSVSPTSATLSIGDTLRVSAAAQQPSQAAAATISYSSNNTSVATVNATTGLITAVSPGNAVINVRAQAAASASYLAGDVTVPVAITVNRAANATVAAILQGPTVSTSLDSSYSGVSTGSATNTPIGPQQGTIAGIRFAANGQLDQSVDILNVKDQIQVDVDLEPNGQRIRQLNVYLCPIGSGAPSATCGDAIPAAIQTFANDVANPGVIRFRINTAEFTVDEAAGTAAVRHPNGRYVVRTEVVPVTGSSIVSQDDRSILNLNNIDGFALALTRPANSQNDANGRTWWGGPTTSDIGQPTGRGTFRVYAVMYTPGRQITAVEATFGRCLGFQGSGLPNSVSDNTLPFDFSYGTANATGATTTHISCSNTGAHDAADQFRFEDFPMVVASRDNQNNQGPRTIYAYNPSYAAEAWAGPRPTLFRIGTQQPVTAQAAVRVDYQGPVQTLVVTQANNERWVNGAYAFQTGYTATDVQTNQYTGVGLFATASRNTIFRTANFGGAESRCYAPQAFADVTGGLTATVQPGMQPLRAGDTQEHFCDFTNNAYVAQVTETDRLGNRSTFGDLASGPRFGVDLTAPAIEAGWTATRGSGAIGGTGNMPNFYASTGDSIFQPARATPVAPYTLAVPAVPAAIATAAGTPANPTDFYFGVRYRDERSGLNINDHGSRRVWRIRPASTPLNSNVAVAELVSQRTMNFNAGFGNPVETEDPTWRRDSVFIYGRGPLASTAGSLTPQAEPEPGYYEYEVSLVDRAGNRTAMTRQRAVIDAYSPIVTGVTLPAVFGATGTEAAVQQAVYPTGNDDLEAIDSDLFLRYPAMGLVGDGSAGSQVVANAARVRFRRDRFANWHNAWQAFGDTLLSTPFGPGARLSSAVAGPGMLLPIKSIRGIEAVDSTDAPVAYGLTVGPFADFKPNAIGVYAFDVRATRTTAISTAAQAYVVAPYQFLGMTALRPATEAAYVDSMFQSNTSNGTRWDTKDLDNTAAGVDRLVSWAFNAPASSTSLIEVRAVTSTIVTRPPFPEVHLMRWETNANRINNVTLIAGTDLDADSVQGQWVYVGTLTAAAPSNPLINDQGSTRFWRYQFTSSAFPSVTNGRILQNGVAAGCYRAVGVDASGDGISTRSFTVGTAPATSTCPAPTAVVAATTTLTYRAYGNGAGTISSGTPALTLTKTTGTEVRRVSVQTANNADVTITITPAFGSQIQQAPAGCSTLSAATYPTTATITCTLTGATTAFAPRTITAIFEQTTTGGGSIR